MQVQAIQGLGLGRQRLHGAAGQLEFHPADDRHHQGGQVWILLNDFPGGLVDNGRLVILGGNGHALCARLPIRHQHIDHDASGQKALAILPGYQEKELPEPAELGLAIHPPKEGLDERLLPQLQLDQLPGLLPLVVTAEGLDEPDGVVAQLGAEPVGASLIRRLRVQALIHLPHRLGHRHRPRPDGTHILADVVHGHGVTCPSPGSWPAFPRRRSVPCPSCPAASPPAFCPCRRSAAPGSSRLS